MKAFLLLCTASIFLLCCGNNKQASVDTSRAGTYTFETKALYGDINLYISPKGDYYIGFNGGYIEPPYNSGGGKFKLKKVDDSTFVYDLDSCQFKVTFKGKYLIAETTGLDYCGFGMGVRIDGTYKKVSNENNNYYFDAVSNSTDTLFFNVD